MNNENRLVPDFRSETVQTITETYTPEGGTEQTATYKIGTAHPIISGILDKLAWVRTHVAAVWWNKLAGVTLKDKIDTMDESIAQLNGNIIKSGDVIKLKLAGTVLAGVANGRAQGFFAFPFKLPNANYSSSLSAVSLGNIGTVSVSIFYQAINGVVLDVTSTGITNGSAYIISNTYEAEITITVIKIIGI